MGRVSHLGLLRAGASAAVVAALMANGARVGQAGGSIRGTVTAAGVTAPDPIAVKQDEAVCGKTQPDPSLAIGPSGAVSNAVVILTGTKGGSSDAANVVNKQCRFAPHVQVVAPGKPLKVGSEDSVLHTTHAYAEDERTLFNIAIPMAGLTITRPIDKTKVVRLQCDTHPWMRGYVIVTDERSAISGADGHFQIDQVPPGTYEVRLWHEKLKSVPQKVTVAAGSASDVAFKVSP